jgi:negative regulator of sigma E activity
LFNKGIHRKPMRVMAIAAMVTAAVVGGGVSVAAAYADDQPTGPAVTVTPSPGKPEATPAAGKPEATPAAGKPEATPAAR